MTGMLARLLRRTSSHRSVIAVLASTAQPSNVRVVTALAGPGDTCRLCLEVIDGDDDCACTRPVERSCAFCGGHGIKAAP